MEVKEQEMTIDLLNHTENSEEIMYVSNFLRKELWKDFDTSVELGKWYRFKLDCWVADDPSHYMTMVKPRTLKYAIQYEVIPECDVQICKTMESYTLIPEKSFWKRLKNAIKYLFKGGKDDVSSRR